MTYKCLDCGHIFDEREIACWSEGRGEYWGTPCSEEMSGCPECGGDFEEAVACAICGEKYLSDELFGGVCEGCIDEHRHDFEMCARICGSGKTEIKINALIATILDIDDIEAILYHYIKEKCADVDCSAFIDDDIYWFAETLAEEVNKNENAKV